MAKKNKQQSRVELPPAAPVKPVISKRGWKVIAGGIGTAVVGYFILSLADPMGQNWASNVSPFLILAGYALIGIGLILKDPNVDGNASRGTVR